MIKAGTYYKRFRDNLKVVVNYVSKDKYFEYIISVLPVYKDMPMLRMPAASHMHYTLIDFNKAFYPINIKLK